MCGVIVVDAESFRSTCFGRDAYTHDHRLDILITMLNFVNCSTVICSPTVEYLCSREKPLVKPMAPGSISYHICFQSTFICIFTFCIYIIKYQKYIYLMCDWVIFASLFELSVWFGLLDWSFLQWEKCLALGSILWCPFPMTVGAARHVLYCCHRG